MSENLRNFITAFVFFSLSTGIAYKYGYFKINIEDEERRFLPFSYVFLGFLALLSTFFLILPILVYHFVKTFSIEVLGWWNVIGMVIWLILSLSIFYSMQSWMRHKIFKSSVRSFLIGAFSLFIGYPLVLAISHLIRMTLSAFIEIPDIDQVAVRHLKKMAVYPSLYMVTIFCVIIIGPILEEFLFRGLLQTSLRRYGRKIAIPVASLAFAAFHLHMTQGLVNIEIFIALFSLSILLGFLYEKEQSLLAPIGLHIVFNALNVGFMLVN